MAVASYFDTVQKLYIAFYQRPADPSGLYYWAQRMDVAGGSLEGMIDAFASSDEAVRLYDTNTDGKIDAADTSVLLDKVYQALFNRAPDAAGKQFYVDALAAGKFPDGRPATIGRVVLDVLNGANDADAVAVANKLEYATAFTKTLDPELDGIGPFQATYNEADEAGARTLLTAVTADPTTRKTAAQVAGEVQSNIADAGDPILNQQTTGQTFTLTAGPDNRTGTEGNDIFDGATGVTVGTSSPTLNSFDTIDGKGGMDTIIVNQGAITDNNFAGVSSVEGLITGANNGVTLGTQAQRAGIMSVTSTGGGNLTLGSGYTNDVVTFQSGINSVDTVDFQNKAANTNLRVTFTSAEVGNGTPTDLTATAPQDGGLAVRVQAEDAADALVGGVSRFDDEGTIFRSSTDNTIRFDVRDISGTQRGTFNAVVLGTAGAETLNAFAGVGTGSLVGTYINGGAGNDVLNGNTGNDFLVGGAGDDTLDFSAVAGGTAESAIGGAGNDTIIASGTTNDSLSGDDGNDTITAAAGNDNIDGGNGDDLFILAGNLTVNDTVAGGEGTDTVALNDASTLTALTGARLTSIEALRADATGTYNASFITGLNSVVANATAAVTFTNLGATTSLGITEVANNTVTASLAANTTADSITVKIGASTAAGGTGSTVGAVTLNDYETITINSTGGTTAAANTIASVDSTSATRVNVQGDRDLTLTAFTASGASLKTLDAGTFTGKLNMQATLSGTSVTITGGTKDDTLRGGTGNDSIGGAEGNDSILGAGGNDTLAGGAGNDTITATGTGNDVITGGDGDDTITGATGNDNIDGGAGNDTIVVNATDAAPPVLDISSADTINGGDGTDVIRIDGTFTAARTIDISTAGETRFNNVSNIEAVQLNSTGASAAVGATVLTVGDVSMGAFGGNLTVSIATGNVSDHSVNAAAVLNSAAKVTFTGNSGINTYTLGNGIDTVNLGTGNDVAVVSNILYLKATDVLNGATGADTLTFTGNAATTVTAEQLAGVSGFETLLVDTNDGSAYEVKINDAVVNANKDLATNVFTITRDLTTDSGTLKVDANAITAGKLAINGGTGADTIIGGTLDDVLSGNAGADSIVGGAGADTIVGGAGVDTVTGGVGVDTFDIATAAASGADRNKVTDFTAGTGGDVLRFAVAATDLTGTDNFTTSAAIETLSGVGGITVGAATEVVRVTGGAIANNLAVSTVANDLDGINLTAITGTITGSAAANDKVLFAVADQFGNVGVYYGNDANNDNTIAAGEITLVGVLQNTSLSSLVFSNFADAA